MDLVLIGESVLFVIRMDFLFYEMLLSSSFGAKPATLMSAVEVVVRKQISLCSSFSLSEIMHASSISCLESNCTYTRLTCHLKAEVSLYYESHCACIEPKARVCVNITSACNASRNMCSSTL